MSDSYDDYEARMQLAERAGEARLSTLNQQNKSDTFYLLEKAARMALDILDSEFTTVDGEFCRWCDGRLNSRHNCKLEQTITALKTVLSATREHVTDGSPCWCNPELNYVDSDTGVKVWVHKEPQ